MSHFNTKVAGTVVVGAIVAVGALYGMHSVSLSRMEKISTAKAGDAVTELIQADIYEEISLTGLPEEYQAVKKAFKAIDEGGNTLGYISLLSVPGYNGNMEVNVSTDASGEKIVNLRIGANGETENLGAKAAEEPFYSQFSGVSAPTDFNEIQAITGATITSTAVVDAANLASDFTKNVLLK